MLLSNLPRCSACSSVLKRSCFNNHVTYFTLCSCSPSPCSYSERLCVHLLDKWLHAANRPVDHSVRCGRIHPQVSPCILRTDDDSSVCSRHRHPPFYHWICVCVCVVVRIGELREVMDDILRKQCDYDPASGESYDFDRFVCEHFCINLSDAKKSPVKDLSSMAKIKLKTRQRNSKECVKNKNKVHITKVIYLFFHIVTSTSTEALQTRPSSWTTFHTSLLTQTSFWWRIWVWKSAREHICWWWGTLALARRHYWGSSTDSGRHTAVREQWGCGLRERKGWLFILSSLYLVGKVVK